MRLIPGVARRALRRVVRRWAAGRERLAVVEFPRWSAALDDALAALPPLPNCPHAVYRALAEPRRQVARVTYLVSERDAPVAVVVLRAAGSTWEPVTTWLTPGRPFPQAGSDVLRVLHALPVPMTLGWWRCADEPPRSRRVAPGAPEPTYGLRCDGDVEGVWRTTGLLPNIRNARRRCENLRVVVDGEGDAEWTIRNWGSVWQVSAERLDDFLLVAASLREASRYHSLVVYDGERRVGGLTQIDDGGELVGQAMCRDRAYDKYSLGTFMFDRHVAWAVERRFSGVDFGGSLPYKERWAPVSGRKYVVRVVPLEHLVGRVLREPWRLLRRAPDGGAQRDAPPPVAGPAGDARET